MNAEVNPAYKQTEAGLIPEEWVVRQLSEHFNIYAGGDVPKHSLSQNQSESHSYPIFANALQNEGLYGYTSERRSKANSLTITARGYLGHAEYRNQPFFPIVRLLVLEPTGELDAKFTSYVVNGRIKFPIESTGVPQLTAPQVGKYSVASPPTIFEQRIIAQALSDMDTLISSLDQLIAKKRNIRQAAMQQLLTGQRRLPEFSGEWLAIKARDIGLFRGGSGFPNRFQGETSGAFPFYKVSDMNNEGNEIFMSNANNHINEVSRKAIGAVIFPSNSIVFAKVGAAVFLERKKILTKSSCLDNNMAAFIVDERRVYVRFMHYALLNIRLSDLASTTALPSLSGSALSNIKLLLPPVSEQTAIATILIEMDTELAALEARRDKTHQLKQGMVQELLTGRIRLTNQGA